MGIDKGVGMSRRRAILMALLSTANYATGFYTLDNPTGFVYNLTYQMRIIINGSMYRYESSYPLYAYKVTDTSFYIVFAVGQTYRTNLSIGGETLYDPAKANLAVIDGIQYAREIYTRSIPTNLCHTNYDMEFWG